MMFHRSSFLLDAGRYRTLLALMPITFKAHRSVRPRPHIQRTTSQRADALTTFFRSTSWVTACSSSASASNFFSRVFSYSRALSRLASGTVMLPNLLRQM
jgi:hypothetical protein